MPPNRCGTCQGRIPSECSGQHVPGVPTDKPPKPPKR